jgi:hypothetical protein
MVNFTTKRNLCEIQFTCTSSLSSTNRETKFSNSTRGMHCQSQFATPSQREGHSGEIVRRGLQRADPDQVAPPSRRAAAAAVARAGAQVVVRAAARSSAVITVVLLLVCGADAAAALAAEQAGPPPEEAP